MGGDSKPHPLFCAIRKEDNMILKGQNVILKMGGVAIAAAKSCSVDVDVDMIKVSSPTDGAWEHSIAGCKSWKASCSHLVTQISDSVAMVPKTVEHSAGATGSEASHGKDRGKCE